MTDTDQKITSISPVTDVLVLGAGLAGLSAAHTLTSSQYDVITVEKNNHIGGLARTVQHGKFRFDLGGHRFLTNDKKVDTYVKNLLAGDYLTVSRSSKILLKNKYFDYPLRPVNSVFGFGIFKSIRILLEYSIEKLKSRFRKREQKSLDEWVTSRFGKTMYQLYFREYSEKVWGIECNRIDKEWIAQRIQGLSLGDAVKAAILKRRNIDHTTLTDTFIYPHLGIGTIADRLAQGVVKKNEIQTSASLVRLNHENGRIKNAVVQRNGHCKIITAQEYISSIPLTAVVNALTPAAPQYVLDAARRLSFRDLVTVTLMISKDRVTDQTWIYFPGKAVPFGRIHEPTNWSVSMAPPGNTSLVAEYFCFKNDTLWKKSDQQLVEQTIDGLVGLNIVSQEDVVDSKVIRIPNAYPLFEVGYMEQCETIMKYLDRFENLSLTGRSGMFRYFNMDHTIGSGMATAKRIIDKIPKPVRLDEKLKNRAR